MRKEAAKSRAQPQQAASCFHLILLIAVALVILVVFIESGVASKCNSKTDVVQRKGLTYATIPLSDPPLEISLKQGKRMAIWKTISSKMCPGMIPQSSKYDRHLFRLAQMEIRNASQLSETTNCTALKEQTPDHHKEFSVRFFEHHNGWDTISYLDQGHSEIYSYLSIWKCANNQIRMFEKQVFGDGYVWFVDRWKTFSKRNHTKNLSGKLTDCITAVIRDPISHFLSGYNEIEFRLGVELKDPRESIAKAWPFGSQPMGSEERFEQFVADLVTCPIRNNLPGIVEKLPNNLEMEHVYSMSAILRLIERDPNIDNSKINFHYLPSLANLDQLWAPFVLFSCPLSFSNETKIKFVTTPMIEDSVKHYSSADPVGTYEAAKKVMKKEGPVSKALCALHLMDYACWPDLPDGVPKVCMDLYMDYHKRDLLLL